MKKVLFSMFVLVVLSSFMLTSCSMLPKQSSSQSKRVLDKSTYATAQPSDFDGPWASDIAKEVAGAKSDYVYSVLKDSKITDQEFQETKSKLIQCYKDSGLSTKFATEPIMLGSYVVVIPGADGDGNGGKLSVEARSVSQMCEDKAGYIDLASLYYGMLLNPEKQDLSHYSAQCLIKLGFRSDGYSGAEFNSEFKGIIGSAQNFFGNKSTKVNAGLNVQFGEIPSEEEVESALNGRPSKNVISYIDLSKCVLTPKAVLNGTN
jgi:hypothetical protein